MNNSENLTFTQKLKFRNYRPKDADLRKRQLPRLIIPEVLEEIEEKLDKLLLDEQNIGDLAPKKPTWDLKRDLSRKMKKLDKKTQEAIFKLIQQKISQEMEETKIQSITSIDDKVE